METGTLPARLGRQDIESLLPHRDPILLVRWAEPAPDGSGGRGEMAITGDVVWNGTTGEAFADELLLEGVAQIGGTIASTGPRAASDTDALNLLTAFRNIRFRKGRPADCSRPILVEILFLARMGSMRLAAFVCRQDDEVLAEGEVSFA